MGDKHSEQSKDGTAGRLERVLAVVALALILLLPFVYDVLHPNNGFGASLRDLLRNVIPNLIAALLIFVLIYFFLKQKGTSC